MMKWRHNVETNTLTLEAQAKKRIGSLEAEVASLGTTVQTLQGTVSAAAHHYFDAAGGPNDIGARLHWGALAKTSSNTTPASRYVIASTTHT